MINAAELAQLRAAFNVKFDATARIQRPTRTPDPGGGWRIVWATVARLDCSYYQSQVTPREVEGTTTVRAITFWVFLFPAGSDVRTADRIQVGTRTWEVAGGGGRSTEIQRAITAMEIT